MIVTPGAGWAPRPAPYGLTAQERCAILNWACFDALEVIVPPSWRANARYVNSLEFQSEDVNDLYGRMRRILEAIPVGDPVALDEQRRDNLHKMLDDCWFSKTMSDHVSMWPNDSEQKHCYMRARYLFVSHWLAQAPMLNDGQMHVLIHRAADHGLDSRPLLGQVSFHGKGMI